MKKRIGIAVAAFVTALILILKPFSLDLMQTVTLAAVACVIVCWTFDLGPKWVSSIILIGVLLIVGTAPAKTVLSFPLSATFPMIVLCYLFSRGIRNSGVTKALIDPLLAKFGNTPTKVLAIMIASLFVGIKLIPQPLVRLIMLAEIFGDYLDRVHVDAIVKDILLYALFEFYIIVNAGLLGADIIFNTTTVSFAGVDISESQWAKLMLLPTLVYLLVSVVVYCFVFRKDLFGIHFASPENAAEKGLSSKQKVLVAIVIATMVFWMSKPLHGISENIVTLVAVAAMFAIGFLKLSDYDCIDIGTLVFLSAAYAIGGSLTASGIASQTFVALNIGFPSDFSIPFVLLVVVSSMALHLILGSNTTTLSIAIPAFISLCGNTISPTILTLLVYMSLIPHHVLPFHCVGMAIGVGNGYFKAKMVAKVGLIMTILIFIAILLIYIPWWRTLGQIPPINF